VFYLTGIIDYTLKSLGNYLNTMLIYFMETSFDLCLWDCHHFRKFL